MSKKTSGIAALILLTLGTAAVAQEAGQAADLQRVEVSGKPLPAPTRYDVSKACPGVAESLQQSLAMVAWREGQTGTVRMNFRLTGSKVDEVHSASGLYEYRRAARRAVYRLACADAAGQPQQFSFLISFNAPEEAGAAPSRVALLER